MADQDIKMDTKKVLSNKGKERMFNAIKEYAHHSFIFYHSQCKEYKEYEKAEKELRSVIMGLEWRI